MAGDPQHLCKPSARPRHRRQPHTTYRRDAPPTPHDCFTSTIQIVPKFSQACDHEGYNLISFLYVHLSGSCLPLLPASGTHPRPARQGVRGPNSHTATSHSWLRFQLPAPCASLLISTWMHSTRNVRCVVWISQTTNHLWYNNGNVPHPGD